MKHLVTKLFLDKESGDIMLLGSFYSCEDVERINHLSSHGFIIPNPDTQELEKQIEVKPKAQRKQRSKAVHKDVTEG